MVLFHEMVALGREGRYREALARLDDLRQPVEAAEAIQHGLLPPDPEWVTRDQRGLSAWRLHFTELAERSDGRLGRRRLLGPEQAGFRTDAHDEGLGAQWQRDDVAEGLEWKPIGVTRDWSQSGYRDADGYAFPGPAWYRFRFALPADADAGAARLYVPMVYAEKTWIWVNGQLVFSPTSPIDRYAADMDVSGWLRPGAPNTITFRMVGTRDRTQHHGLGDRWLLYTPVAAPGKGS
jgi:hypothetical protein